MKLRKLHIQNFRGIKTLELELDDTTVLIGENNTGKTAVLHALRLCLYELGSRRRLVFNTFDFHFKDASSEPSSADPIQITLTFSEAAQGEWDQPLIAQLQRQKIVQLDQDGRGHVVFRVICSYDPQSKDYNQNWSFLNTKLQPLTGVPDTAISTVQRESTYYYLPALRDAARHFDANGPFWRPFLKDSNLDPDKKNEIERQLAEVNKLVVGSHESFSQVIARLKKVQEVVQMSAGDIVSIAAVPGRAFDMLARSQVLLGTLTGAKVPVDRHGEGTQSLAVLMLFSAFLENKPQGTPIVALEEPEAHLHPSAVRALWGIVKSITGQKLFSTHSGDLLSEIPASALRRLVTTTAGTQVFRLKQGTLSPDEERKFNFHIRFARGELLFARCWLLVEGETEVTLLSEIAQHLDINLELAGVRCVPHRHCGVELFLKVAKDLGIRWCVLADNDGQGKADQKHARNYAGASPLADLLHVMPEDDIEQHLCVQGFGSIYQAVYDAHPQVQQARPVTPPSPQPSTTARPSDAAYWPELLKAIKSVLTKPVAAMEVIRLIRTNAVPVPPLLADAIQKAIALAGAP